MVNPACVRPLFVLKEWSETLLNQTETKEYAYVLDQFQAIRQDLMVCLIPSVNQPRSNVSGMSLPSTCTKRLRGSLWRT